MDKLRSLIAELSWNLYSARFASSSSAVPTEALRVADQHSKKLRQLLRKTPSWSRGHLLLATNALERFRLAADRTAVRDLATARISAEAVLALLGQSPLNRRRVLAERVLAQVAHYERDYQQALALFSALGRPERQRFLEDTEAASILEFSGAAALALEDYEAALAFFSSIPQVLQSGETRQAIAFLSARQSENFSGASSSVPPQPTRA